jgi:oligogalacturonide lyase
MFTREEIPGEREYWFAPFSAAKPRLLAKGKISSAYWRPDGQALLFLRQVEYARYTASQLAEVLLDGSPEHGISETAQFAAFAPNTDGSVFVGASRSKAQPDIVLLLRSTRREMVLCEHRSSTPEAVTPSFSPNSQRVYFQSDHDGKSAIYSVNVERLIEKTDDEAS